MKLVNEIAEQVLKKVDGWRSTLPNGEWENEDINAVANIIAAKLVPTTKALKALIETCESSDVQEYGERPDKAIIRQAQEVLVTLPEDEIEEARNGN